MSALPTLAVSGFSQAPREVKIVQPPPQQPEQPIVLPPIVLAKSGNIPKNPRASITPRYAHPKIKIQKKAPRSARLYHSNNIILPPLDDINAVPSSPLITDEISNDANASTSNYDLKNDPNLLTNDMSHQRDYFDDNDYGDKQTDAFDVAVGGVGERGFHSEELSVIMGQPKIID
ncbi:hypothetical protein TRFO_31580 [Tritrichomonas foetus]|uniref:Uncharacterized protein n=1 Tax=Tritrichomonas foetus TaxID=1144522 RepID=A0A1J4JR88_9EUKA|nr:hypothetical protein TRFO_31580 [Tritrichomonas foetus]|eukprot:OHT01547.1 hypothetical protein TRFO_31580 [Tritrichomonas foetus]